MVLASFMFPVALMFLITGGFYTWGIKGSYDKVDYAVILDKPLTKNEAALTKLVQAELLKRGIDAPTGKASLRNIGQGYQLEWSGSKRDIILEPSANPLQATLTVKEASWYRHFVNLHKAKGGAVFKVFAALFAVALFLILASGFFMAWAIPTFRRMVTISTVSGLAAFIFAMAYS